MKPLPRNGHKINLTIIELCYHIPAECYIEMKSLSNKLESAQVHIEVRFCITESESLTFVIAGFCPYFPQSNITWDKFTESRYYILPSGLAIDQLTDFNCRFYNKEGKLCRECRAGYGPAVYAFSLVCAQCCDSPVVGWLLYFFLVLFPITVFYIFVIIFNIQATAPPFSAFVLMSQTFCMMELTYMPLEMKLGEYKELSILLQIVRRVLCGFWNLDFFRYLVPPFCVSSNLSTLQALNLEYIHVIYPLFLVFITFICIELHTRNCKLLIVLWKPFHRCVVHLRRSLDPRASIVNAFSTFLLLNLSKLVFVTRNSIYTTTMFHVDSALSIKYTSFLYADPNIQQYSKQHIPYLLVSVMALATFFAIPTALLCLYPTKIFRRLLQCCLPL